MDTSASQSSAVHIPTIADSCAVLMQLPGVVVVKDLTSRIVAANSPFRELLGVSQERAIGGHYEADLAPCLGTAHASFLAQDRDIQARRRGRFLDVLRYPDGQIRAVLAHKVCLLDGRGHPGGLLFQGFIQQDAILRSMGAALSQHIDRDVSVGGTQSYCLDKPMPGHELSEREAECLFFLLRGHTARRIAQRLHLSPRTVEGYIEQLKSRFGAATKTCLIDNALREGFSHVLPQSLLHFP